MKIVPAMPAEIFDQNSKNGRLESFTFKRQNKFEYVKIISDYIEQNIPQFSNIWPFLGAYTFNGSWDPDIDENLEFIGIAHYTVLKSFSYIFQNKDSVKMNDPNQRFKNIIFHYALIIDCIKQITFHIVKFKHKLNPIIKMPVTRLGKAAFLKKMEDWYDKEYNERFETFLENGGLIMKEIHSTNNYVSLLNKNKCFKSFHKFNERINPYRNVFVHNPSIDIFLRGKAPYVVNSEYIKSTRTIQSIRRLSTEDLNNPSDLMDQLFKQATKMLSDVWKIFYKEIESINTNPNFLIYRQNN